jgi:hypothetical protein
MEPGFDSRQVRKNFVFSRASRPTLEPTQPPIQSVEGALSPGLKRPRREANGSPSSNTKFENGGVIPPLPYTSSWDGA